MASEKKEMASTSPLIVSFWLDLLVYELSLLENDPLEIARQMAERGINLVCWLTFSPSTFSDCRLTLQFVIACEPSLSKYKVGSSNYREFRKAYLSSTSRTPSTSTRP